MNVISSKRKSQNSSKKNSPWLSNCVPELRPELSINKSLFRQIYSTISQRKSGEPETYTTLLNYQATISSNASGVAAPVYSNAPSSCPDFAGFSSKWDEYRILGMKFTFEPVEVIGGSTSSTRGPWVIATDYDDPTALVGYDVGNLYSDSVRRAPDRRFSHISVNESQEGAPFLPLASTNNIINVKLYSANNSVSTILGYAFVEFIIQFRGRGL
jgi:hypothetical protein